VSEPLLRVSALCGGYGASRVLFDVSFDLQAGSVLAVLGRNGAGKTTLLRTLLGYLRPTSGQVFLDHEDVTGLAPARLVRRGVGYMPQEQVVFPSLTVEENLILGANAAAMRERDAVRHAYALFPKLGERRRQQAGTLSGGERKMVGLARALLAEPRLLILDEPTEGVWPGVVDEIVGALRDYSTRGALLLVEQHFELAMGLADTVVVLQRGEIVMEGAARELRDSADLVSYLAPTAASI
jgi:ABC-type branched-subunit amino acid transport system ATPase component